MLKNPTLVVLTLSQVFTAILGLILYLPIRKRVLEAFSEYNTELPPLTRIVASNAFLPVALFIGTALVLGAVALSLRRSQRNALAATGLVVSASGVALAAWGLFAPFFQPR